MYGQSDLSANSPPAAPSLAGEWLTAGKVLLVCTILLTISVCIMILQYSQAENLTLPPGTPVGGDYVAFFGASKAAASGNAAAMYDAANFEAHLLDVGPPRDSYKLTWQYPPTAYLLIAPLAFLPYVFGLVLWIGGTAAVFFTTLRRIGVPLLGLFIILASPVTLHAVVTGQNGFLTASLLAIAALYGRDKPIIAGLAAAALTFKPQLGLLIPVAWIAAGYWRAFGVAAIGSLVFAAVSILAYGPEVWLAFFGGAVETSGRVADGIMPLYKMVTPYAWTKHLTGSSLIAGAVGAIAAIASIIVVFRVWRAKIELDLKAATLCVAVFFAAPYGFYYELTILVLPMVILVRHGIKDGWLAYEQLLLAGLFLLPMTLPGNATVIGFSTGFPIVALTAICVARRLHSWLQEHHICEQY